MKVAFAYARYALSTLATVANEAVDAVVAVDEAVCSLEPSREASR